MHHLRSRPLLAALCACFIAAGSRADEKPSLAIAWEKGLLTVTGPRLSGGDIRIHYLEAYCRPGSTDREWGQTVIGHTTRLLSAREDRKKILLRCTLQDGAVVDHAITAGADEVDFRLTATNPTERESLAHWAQPCIRVDTFVGVPATRAGEEYLPKSFIFVAGKLERMPVQPWAKKARYVPGQVWVPPGVSRDDVNPRPLSDIVPSNGLIGCFSEDESTILAVAFEPYQELFQGVITCLHSDFRIGGLKPGEAKRVRGKLYCVKNDVEALLERYRQDFPEQVRKQPTAGIRRGGPEMPP